MSSLPSTVIVGTDHAGFELKEALIPLLAQHGFTIHDLSPTLMPNDDYPQISHEVAIRVTQKPEQNWGVLFCGSGIGASMVANRHAGIRAALIRNEIDASMAREHNHANILVLGGRITKANELSTILDAWISTAPSQEERHTRRIQAIDEDIDKK